MGYDDSWDRPHEPGPDAHWQESDCYWFYDAERGVGGFHRLGQKPNLGTGQITLFAFHEGSERFVLNVAGTGERVLNADARQPDRHVVGTHRAQALGGARMRFAWEEDGCAADLEFYEAFYPPRDWSKTGHSDEFMSNLNSDGHLECSGRLRGRIRIGAVEHEIDALCHRDRSWGFRDNARASLHRYRMFSGTIGPELSFASFLLDAKGGPAMTAGFVVRDGVDKDVHKLRVMTTFDSDGITPLAATAVLTLEDGEELRLEAYPRQGFLNPVPEAQCAAQDHISLLHYRGRTGFVDLELCTNPGRGTYIPTQADVTFTAIDQGLSSFTPYER